LSVGLVAGPASPTLRLLREDSINCGAKRRLGRNCFCCSSCRPGDGERGEGSGVGSGFGRIVFCSSVFLLDRLVEKVVSMGSGTNRRRGFSGVVMMKERENTEGGQGSDWMTRARRTRLGCTCFGRSAITLRCFALHLAWPVIEGQGRTKTSE
jgi:hypothetical protein